MKLRHIEYFLTLAEELHFRRAADKLFIAQPALTRQIKELEEQLGVVLFKRDKRNVALTQAGKYLQAEGHQLLKRVDLIKSSIADLGSTLNGIVNIGCIGSAMTSIIPELVLEMSEHFPGVKTNLVESTTANLLNHLKDGQIDVLIGRPHTQLPNIHSEVVFTDSTQVVLAANSKWNIMEDSKISALQDIPFIIFPRSAGTYFRDRIISICSQYGFHPDVKHESINTTSILKLVEKDIGLSIMPKSITQGYQLDLNYLDMEQLNIPLDIVVSYRTDLNDELPQTIAEIVKRQIGVGYEKLS